MPSIATLTRRAEKERQDAHAALRARWEMAGGLWYCRTHAVLARWVGTPTGGAAPLCWKCDQEGPRA